MKKLCLTIFIFIFIFQPSIYAQENIDTYIMDESELIGHWSWPVYVMACGRKAVERILRYEITLDASNTYYMYDEDDDIIESGNWYIIDEDLIFTVSGSNWEVSVMGNFALENDDVIKFYNISTDIFPGAFSLLDNGVYNKNNDEFYPIGATPYFSINRLNN